MRDAMANNPNDWSHFHSNQSLFTTTTTVTTTASPAASASVGGDSSRLSPDSGRVSKPARRRTRASRRTPTTMLNTDTANFRAMVQQFTGGPSATAFGSGQGFSLTPSSPAGAGLMGGANQQPPWQFQYQPVQQAGPFVFSLANSNPLAHNINPNPNIRGGFNTAVSDGFGSAEEQSGGGGGGGGSSWFKD